MGLRYLSIVDLIILGSERFGFGFPQADMLLIDTLYILNTLPLLRDSLHNRKYNTLKNFTIKGIFIWTGLAFGCVVEVGFAASKYLFTSFFLFFFRLI